MSDRTKSSSPLRIPRLRHHKPSGQAVVTLAGRDIYLGPWGSKTNESRYRAAIAEWMNAGSPRGRPSRSTKPLRVDELVAAYWKELERKAEPATKMERTREAMRPLVALYGSTIAADFGPRKLKAVRSEMIHADLSRSTINGRIQRIRRLFRWAVEEELLPGTVSHALTAVSGLRRGEEDVREGRKIRPAEWEHVEPVLSYVSREVAAMIQLQWWTGARSGELVSMRPSDLDRLDSVWLLRPKHHKTEHHGRSREIAFGPRAQEVLRPFLDRVPPPNPKKPIFSPARAEEERSIERRARRESPVQPSQRRRQLRRQERRCRYRLKRPPRDAYDPNTYARAIRRGIALVNATAAKDAIKLAILPRVPKDLRDRFARFIDHSSAQVTEDRITRALKQAAQTRVGGSVTEVSINLGPLVALAAKAFKTAPRIPCWHPHMLRHSAATRLRKEHGIEAARVVLGHAGAAVTELYAEIDHEKARRIAQVSG